MRYRLRTLLILLAALPPLLAGGWWGWQKYLDYRRQRMFDELIELITTTIEPQSCDFSHVPPYDPRPGDADSDCGARAD